MKSVMNDQQYNEVEKMINDFGKPGGIGEKLQEELIKRHDNMDNWVCRSILRHIGYFPKQIQISN